MARRKISKELWTALEPLIPVFKPSPKGGRRRTVDDRAALNGILYVLQTGIQWEDLPQELGFGSGMTCWRRLRDWQAAGVWHRLREHDQIDWERASLDGASVSSPRGAKKPATLGSKRHIVVDAHGIPLAVTITRANRHDSMAFEPTLDSIPAVPGLNGQPRKRPSKLHADKGYDFARCRRYLRQRGIKARIARRGIESSERLGRHRWVVERTHAWFAGFGKLRIRFERRLDIHAALLVLAAAVICSRFVDDLC
ncbi:IS5 family transposase [Burkholderia paludis]|uniref:IS5 family transposase n=1 Tax=Burkholderia paludis TaxID=1506587 RepID=UPI0009471153|nr:IS5 family transposase [Burkholderia paludis]